MFARKDKVVDRLRRGVEGILRKRGVTLHEGRGELVEPGVVSVSGDHASVTIESNNVILATGSAPIVPDSMQRDGRIVMTSRDVLARSDLPESIVIIGAGSVGCEFAALYSGMGVRVTLVEMLPQLLPQEDSSAARVLLQSFKRRGLDVRTETKVEEIRTGDGRAVTQLSSGGAVESDAVLLAIGRRPALDEANVHGLGLQTDDGAVVVDDAMKTSAERTYAVGDLVGGWMLAHVASREGVVAASQAAGLDTRISYRAVPRCTFTTPEVASVGITTDEARAQGIELREGRFPFTASGKAVASGEAGGFVKVLSDASSGEVVGGVVVGPHASDLIHEITLAVEARLPASLIAETIHAHPTLSEAVCEAAEAVAGLSVHSM
jgi:dihydrolipoamide dehydrogenase